MIGVIGSDIKQDVGNEDFMKVFDSMNIHYEYVRQCLLVGLLLSRKMKSPFEFAPGNTEYSMMGIIKRLTILGENRICDLIFSTEEIRGKIKEIWVELQIALEMAPPLPPVHTNNLKMGIGLILQSGIQFFQDLEMIRKWNKTELNNENQKRYWRKSIQDPKCSVYAVDVMKCDIGTIGIVI